MDDCPASCWSFPHQYVVSSCSRDANAVPSDIPTSQLRVRQYSVQPTTIPFSVLAHESTVTIYTPLQRSASHALDVSYPHAAHPTPIVATHDFESSISTPSSIAALPHTGQSTLHLKQSPLLVTSLASWNYPPAGAP